MAGTKEKLGPIEVWLEETGSGMQIAVRYVRPDETVRLGVSESFVMRGAQRLVSGELIDNGWQPVGRWVTEREENGAATACYRNFRPGPDAQPL